MTAWEVDPCERCEEMMQPFLDRVLDDVERAEAELHLAGCGHCRTRYTFEASLRSYVRQACTEVMPPELKARLSALRTPL